MLLDKLYCFGPGIHIAQNGNITVTNSFALNSFVSRFYQAFCTKNNNQILCFRARHFPIRYNITTTTVKSGCLSLNRSTRRAKGVHSARDSGVSGRNSSLTSWRNYRASVTAPVCQCRRYFIN